MKRRGFFYEKTFLCPDRTSAAGRERSATPVAGLLSRYVAFRIWALLLLGYESEVGVELCEIFL